LRPAFGSSRVKVGDNHAGSGFRQRHGAGQADASPTAGDDGDAAIKAQFF